MLKNHMCIVRLKLNSSDIVKVTRSNENSAQNHETCRKRHWI